MLIVADDLGWGDVGFNGRNEWSTPNLDRLAKEGRVLERRYAAGVVCAPSRAAFLTGKATIHSGVRGNNEDLPTEEVTIAERSGRSAIGLRFSASGIVADLDPGRPRLSIRTLKGLTSSSATSTPIMRGRSFPPGSGRIGGRFRSPATSTT